MYNVKIPIFPPRIIYLYYIFSICFEVVQFCSIFSYRISKTISLHAKKRLEIMLVIQTSKFDIPAWNCLIIMKMSNGIFSFIFSYYHDKNWFLFSLFISIAVFFLIFVTQEKDQYKPFGLFPNLLVYFVNYFTYTFINSAHFI